MLYKNYLLMLFDETNDGAGNNDVNDNANNENNSGGASDDKKSGKNDKKYTDADVNAIIDKKFAEWQKKQQKAVDEATKLANMSAQEKAEHERDAWEQKYNELLKENTRATLTVQATKMLQDDDINISSDLVSVLIADDAEKTKENVQNFAKLFKDAVKEEIKNINKKSSPKTGGNAGVTKADILKVKDINERQKLIKENLDLFSN